MKAFLISLIFVSGLAFSQEAFPDIPSGHWAGSAVSRISDLGIVTGFPDGTYRGNESITRYQAAIIIDRLLDLLNRNIAASKALTDADIAALRASLANLNAELEALRNRVDALEANKADKASAAEFVIKQ